MLYLKWYFVCREDYGMCLSGTRDISDSDLFMVKCITKFDLYTCTERK